MLETKIEVKEECTENVTLCVKARDKIVDDDVVNGGSNFESVSSNVGANEAVRKETEWKRKIPCKSLEQQDVMEGEDRMDSLWEIYALLDRYQSDSATKSAQKAVVMKNKRTHKLDYYGNEDDDVQMQTGQPGCLPLKCFARKMNLRMGRTQIVKITKAFKAIDLLPLHHVIKRCAWQKKQILN
ncbi:hypothetical protein POM88_052814 [Heracleum sosnowskyi]|uniref:Uncharacterized protein n=1 Tax=Heracleum sosnowskyi TaxID=360622 RepID=A0AAD8GRY8_9APIA|nr:hypothetical protein POM88_052814 [Heracleum sosnowskyi]